MRIWLENETYSVGTAAVDDGDDVVLVINPSESALNYVKKYSTINLNMMN